MCAVVPDGSRAAEIGLTSRSGWAPASNRGRKRILSQNKRWGANPFPCAVKQSLHSLLSKWHLIWFCCWSLRYPECFQDIYSGCCATLARYEGKEIWWAVTQPLSQKCATDKRTLTHTLYEWWKTSWNKTTGSRSDFTGYTRSCETVMEIQIGLTRVFLWSPRHHRSSALNYNISIIYFQMKISLTQTQIKVLKEFFKPYAPTHWYCLLVILHRFLMKKNKCLFLPVLFWTNVLQTLNVRLLKRQRNKKT